MTLFRKYYKEANNDLSPKEELINRVIQNTHEQQSPSVVKKYYRYTVSIAAAIFIVSAVIISMPFFEHTNDDGVIIQEDIVETAAPHSDSTAASNDSRSAAEPTLPENNTEITTSGTSTPSKHSYDYSNSENMSSPQEHSYDTTSSKDSEPPENNIKTEENSTQRQTDSTTYENDSNNLGPSLEKFVNSEDLQLKQEVAKTFDEEPLPERTPPPVMKSMAASGSSSDSDSRVYRASLSDTSIPTPSGYNCVSASWDGYIFTADDGAVITVKIKYGGEEDSEPYYQTDGSNIYASFTAYGMTVTVSASNADMSTVEEIINSLR